MQVDREILKDTLRELLNEMPSLRTVVAAGSASGSTVNALGMSMVTTGAPPSGGEFIRKNKLQLLGKPFEDDHGYPHGVHLKNLAT